MKFYFFVSVYKFLTKTDKILLVLMRPSGRFRETIRMNILSCPKRISFVSCVEEDISNIYKLYLTQCKIPEISYCNLTNGTK